MLRLLSFDDYGKILLLNIINFKHVLSNCLMQFLPAGVSLCSVFVLSSVLISLWLNLKLTILETNYLTFLLIVASKKTTGTKGLAGQNLFILTTLWAYSGSLYLFILKITAVRFICSVWRLQRFVLSVHFKLIQIKSVNKRMWLKTFM